MKSSRYSTKFRENSNHNVRYLSAVLKNKTAVDEMAAMFVPFYNRVLLTLNGDNREPVGPIIVSRRLLCGLPNSFDF